MNMTISLLTKVTLVAFVSLTLVNCTADSDVPLREVLEPESDPIVTETEETENPPAEITSFLNVSDFDLPAQDEDGFTIISPSAGSQIIYVDTENGDDTTGEVYAENASEIGGDVLNPTEAVKSFATLAKANEHMRENEPDMMLLAAGGVWNESLEVVTGKSGLERSIYAAYGNGPRPEIRSGAEQGITTLRLSNAIVSGIKFWAHTRDDEGSYFSGYEGKSGFFLLTSDDKAVANVLIEDCIFRSYQGNAVQTSNSSSNPQPIHKFVMRRNIVSRQYSADSHSQGVYYQGKGITEGPSLLLEENVFDHNGWRIQRYESSAGMVADEGQATFFNHNTYFSNPKGVLFYGNIFLNPSSMNNKWTANLGEGSASDVAMVDNLYIDGEIGIGIGGNEPGPRRFKNILISNNVMLDIGKSQPTNRDIGWCIEVFDWDGGVIKENLFLHQRNEELKGIFAMNFVAQTAIQNVLVENNIVNGLNGSSNVSGGLVRFGGDGTVGNVQINENFIANTDDTALMSYGHQDGYSFSKNSYSGTQDDNWFGLSSDWASFDSWKTEVGSDAETLDSSIWPDPERDIESYMSTTGKGSTRNDFIEQLYLQSRTTWDPTMTAPYINRWVREGYGR